MLTLAASILLCFLLLWLLFGALGRALYPLLRNTMLSIDPAQASMLLLAWIAMPALIAWSVPVWLFEAATYWALARAMPSLPHPEASWLAMPVGTLSTLLPSTPGHVGTFDFFTQTATAAVGNPLVAATAFALIVHAVLWLSTTLAGGACLLIWTLRRS